MLLSGRELRPAVEISFNTTQKQTQLLVNALIVHVDLIKKHFSGNATNRDLPLHCEFLGRGRRARSDVREASLKQHFKFDDIRTHHAGTIQDPALHLEMADTMLVDELSKIF
jgi:hypothetical protein